MQVSGFAYCVFTRGEICLEAGIGAFVRFGLGGQWFSLNRRWAGLFGLRHTCTTFVISELEDACHSVNL